MGALEIFTIPSNARSSSRIRKTAPATDRAAIMSAMMTVGFRGANRPTLTKMIASQPMTMTSMAVETELGSRFRIVRGMVRFNVAYLGNGHFHKGVSGDLWVDYD